MSTSSLLGIERPNPHAPGHDAEALGPSDSSDSGSDMTGLEALDVDSDSAGTGERRSAAGDDGGREAGDIAVDRVFSPLGDDAGGMEDAEDVDGDDDESADPVGDGHADAALAASLPPRPDRPNPEPDPPADAPPVSPDGDLPPADDGGPHQPGREPALLSRSS